MKVFDFICQLYPAPPEKPRFFVVDICKFNTICPLSLFLGDLSLLVTTKAPVNRTFLSVEKKERQWTETQRYVCHHV